MIFVILVLHNDVYFPTEVPTLASSPEVGRKVNLHLRSLCMILRLRPDDHASRKCSIYNLRTSCASVETVLFIHV